jgi:MFS family permease
MSVGRLLIDVQPLRESPAFRRLWAGSALSLTGSVITSFAVALQMFRLTHSTVAVGLVGLAVAVPRIGLGLIGGSLADTVDRRKLVLVTSSGLAGVSVLLAVQAFAGFGRAWLLYLLVIVQSLLGAVDGPARQTFAPRLLRSEQLPAATALSMLTMHSSATAGPLLAGLLTSVGGLKTCYLVDAFSFTAALYGVFRLPPMTTEPGPHRPGLRAVADGLRYIKGSQLLTAALLADASAMLLGMPFALFPAINAERFGGSSVTLGLLSSSVAIGGIAGAAFSGPVGRVSRQGAAMLVAGAVWGAGLAGFGLAHTLWLCVLMLMIAGAADVLSVIFRTALIQTVTPDEYRGRTSAAEFVVGAGFPPLGSFRGGLVGGLTSPTIGAVSGGLSTVLGAGLIAVTLPALARYRSPTAGSAAAGPADIPPATPSSQVST